MKLLIICFSMSLGTDSLAVDCLSQYFFHFDYQLLHDLWIIYYIIPLKDKQLKCSLLNTLVREK
jgi:hypothetical protein